MAIMARYARTHKAWAVLTHPQSLGRRAHHLLLLANGRRTLPELSILLDSRVPDLAEDLCAQGYLQRLETEDGMEPGGG